MQSYRPSLGDLDNSYTPSLADVDSSTSIAQPNKPVNKESFVHSLEMAPFRMLSDLGGSLADNASKIPGYISEYPDLNKLMFTHPIHAAMQGFAGANEFVNNLAQAPLNMAKYGENRLNLLPSSVPNAISKITPEDTTQSINQLFGQPQYPGEHLLRGIVRNAPLLAGAGSMMTRENALNEVPSASSPLKSDDIAKDIHSTLIGDSSPDQSSKYLASQISSKYKDITDYFKNKYASIFSKDSSQDFPQRDEATKVKDLPLNDSSYLDKFKNFDFSNNSLQKLHDKLLDDNTIQNAHQFQSELGGEIGYLKKQNDKALLDNNGKNLLSTYAEMRNSLKNDIYGSLENESKGLGDQYNDVTNQWQKYVTPFHSDKDLKDIATGKTKNPTQSQIVNIFKNPEENINTVSSMLGQDAKNKIVQAGMGKNKFQNSENDMINAHNSIYSKGLNSYLDPTDESKFISLRDAKYKEGLPEEAPPKKYGLRNAIVSLGGMGAGALAESLLSNPNSLLGAYIGRELTSSLKKKISEKKK